MSKREKVLALLSGGLDSTLAVRIMLDRGVEVEAVHFTTPFCNCDKCAVDLVGKEFDIRIHHVFLGQEFLDLLVDPPHGYGSQMNICIDCRILMFRRAKELAGKLGAEYLVTGEVLGQRPFSQRPQAMRVIDREAGIEGKILRPLSAKLLPETELERSGALDRESLYAMSGRRRTPQMNLAEELGIKDYPCPSGGCLLTDPAFARKLRNYLTHEGRPSLDDMYLLRVGRHFRVGETWVIVGRNEGENSILLSAAERSGIPHMSVVGHMGPVTLIMNGNDEAIQKSAAMTVRYSDAPRRTPVEVNYTTEETFTLVSEAISDEELETFRI